MSPDSNLESGPREPPRFSSPFGEPPTISGTPSVRLDLGYNNLQGELPPETGDLDHLVTLVLRGNRFSGPLVPEIGKLTRLEHLWAENSGFTGAIPPEIGNLEKLTQLSLGSNPFTGPVPATFGRLANLRDLQIEKAGLSGRLPPEMSRMSSLEVLVLNGNSLTGPIPPEWGRLPNIEHIWLNENRLTGPIPPELGNWTKVDALYLDKNQLTGPIPPELGDMSSLVWLTLNNNRLTGAIPAELGRLTKVGMFFLHNNQLTGSLPPELGNMAAMSWMNISKNRLTGPIPGEFGNMSTLWRLEADFNQLTGEIPPELGKLGNLDYLSLRGNQLTGTLSPELGGLGSLEFLGLDDNDLSGPILPWLGDLSMLKYLWISNNDRMSGALPSEATGLDSLEHLLAGGTGLCAPGTADFVDWLKGVYAVRLARCPEDGGQPAAYLVQVVQSRTHPVPLVAGEDALLRVFPTANQETSETIPLVRAVFYVDDEEVHEVDIEGKSTKVPTEVDEGDLDKSANVVVPDSVIAEDLEVVVYIDPDSTLDEDLGITERIPRGGRMPIEVKDMPLFRLTMVPFVWTRTQDSSIVDLVDELVDEQEDHELFAELRMLPIGDMKVTAHDPVLSSSNGAYSLMSQTEALRVLENGKGHYKGTMNPPVTDAGGLANVPGRTSFSQPAARIFAHELGHNFGLYHAPCGGAGGVDIHYPYSEADISVWGYDFSGDSLIKPTAKDLMSYCAPRWMSDFFYTQALRFRGHPRDHEDLPFQESLLLWGHTDEAGRPVLEPTFVVDAPETLPNRTGDHTLTGMDADSTELFSLSFDMAEIADGEGRGNFVFALPVEASWKDRLAIMVLSGPGGSVSVDTDTATPMAILQSELTGQVTGFLDDLPATLSTSAAAAEHLNVDAGNTRVLFSRGLPPRDAWRR